MPSLVVADVARAIDAACAAVGARWFLFGAQAAILRGLVRHTEDVDVTIDLGQATTARLIETLAAHGVVMRLHDADEFVAATRVLPLRHTVSGSPVDAVLAGSGMEERILADAELIAVGGVPVRVPRVEDLVTMKLLAGRPLDVEDAVALLVANPRHDVERMRAALAELEDALGQSDLVPALEHAVRRAQRAHRSRP